MSKNLIFLGLLGLCLHADEKTEEKIANPLIKIGKEDVIRELAENQTYELNFENKSLSEIFSEITKLKNINIYVPDEVKLTDKITINYGIVTLRQAWNYLQMMLDALGLTIIKNGVAYKMVKTSTIGREPLPFYVNIKSEHLPATEDRIRYLYYFANINISSSGSSGPIFGGGGSTPIDLILKDMLPSSSPNNYDYILDPNSNSLMITARAVSIKNVMKIIETIDKTGFRETVAVIPLNHANAQVVYEILKQLIPDQPQQQPGYFPAPNTSAPKFGYYFSENTKINYLDRTNSVVILGSIESVQRVKDFIVKYIDQPLQSGSSILHVKPLQYLDASALMTVLQSVVTADTGKAQSVAQKQLQDTLSKVIITSEVPTDAPQIVNNNGEIQSTQVPKIGGNNLIIAAQREDWKILEQLIDSLDTPQMQVVLEVLVVDVTFTQKNIIASQLRNPTDGFPQNFNFQSAQITKPWLNFIPPAGGTTPLVIDMTRGLAADLLQQTNPANLGINSTINPVNIAQLTDVGSTVISFSNGTGKGIFDILQILENYGNTTILSQPFVVTKNYQPAQIQINEERIVDGSVQDQSTGGPTIIPKVPITASLSVTITPRISKANTINLDVAVTANNFVQTADTGNNTIASREIITNANVGNKEMLVIGGLSKDQTADGLRDFPILSQIPLIGYFFKNKTRTKSKTTLMIFIQPTIIKPRLGGGIDPYTKSKLNYIKQKELEADIGVDGVLFENLRDPITRVMFTPLGYTTNPQIDEYAQTGVFGGIKKTYCNNVIECPEDLEVPNLEDDCRLKELARDMTNPFG